MALGLRIFFGVAALVALTAAARRGRRETLLLAGTPLLFVAVDLAAYYYAFLALLTLAAADRPRRLTALFGLEAATYALVLSLQNDGAIYAYRSLFVGVLAAGWALADVRRASLAA